jgi:hypothetical protein
MSDKKKIPATADPTPPLENEPNQAQIDREAADLLMSQLEDRKKKAGAK